MNYKDISGQKFNKLTAIKPAQYATHGKCTKWLCKCECGNETVVSYTHLKAGHTQSCGCLRQKYGKASARGEQHGMSRTPLYNVWVAMKARIFNPNNRYYHYYGGRGLTINDEWLSFGAFSEWAIANGYKKGLDLDRIDNEKGYAPENCRWVTHGVNLQNTRRKQEVLVNGERIAIAELAKRYGAPYIKVYQMHKRGTAADVMVERLQKWSEKHEHEDSAERAVYNKEELAANH